MGKKKDAFVDDFIGDYDFDETPYVSESKEKKLKKVAANQGLPAPKRSKETRLTPRQKDTDIISDVAVPSTCNKCGGAVEGYMIHYIYQAHSDMNTPLIRYYCPHCKHAGRRSVQEKALKTIEFDKLYFGEFW